MKLNRPQKKIREHRRRSLLLCLGISCFLLGAVLFYSENQPAAAYEQFLEIDYLTALLEERPSLNPSAILASISSNVVIG